MEIRTIDPGLLKNSKIRSEEFRPRQHEKLDIVACVPRQCREETSGILAKYASLVQNRSGKLREVNIRLYHDSGKLHQERNDNIRHAPFEISAGLQVYARS